MPLSTDKYHYIYFVKIKREVNNQKPISMQKKILNGLLLVVILLGISYLSACTSDVIVKPAPTADTIHFSQDLQPQFNDKCIGCHRAGATRPDLTAGNSYDQIMSMNLVNTADPEQSRLYQMVLPTGPTHAKKDQTLADKILAWIRQGALNN